jgi:hypothetical protein
MLFPIAAAADPTVGIVRELLRAEIMPFLLAAVAILVGGAVTITKAVIRHRERIAMIQQGIHPDYPPGTTDEVKTPNTEECRA